MNDIADRDALADAFAAIVRRDLREHLPEINRRNATPEYACACATHDFCDANVLMQEAFEDLFLRETDPASDLDVWLWNEAWSVAKARGFGRE
jgi:hypothetical protein